jgi:hypothetical protein
VTVRVKVLYQWEHIRGTEVQSDSKSEGAIQVTAHEVRMYTADSAECITHTVPVHTHNTQMV